MSVLFDDTLTDLFRDRISNILHIAERHRIRCYLERREWQLEHFCIGYRNDWSHHELLLVLKSRYGTLRRLQRQNPGASGILLLPMIRVAYGVEITSTNSCQIVTV
jgi:hypothetical protein